MKNLLCSVTCLVFATFAMLATHAANGQPSVLTQDYDISRSGANLAETILTPSNVSSATFGKLFTYPVDEEVFAQPLYVPGVVIGGSKHNVVFVATMGNSVYAFDADSAASIHHASLERKPGSGGPIVQIHVVLRKRRVAQRHLCHAGHRSDHEHDLRADARLEYGGPVG